MALNFKKLNLPAISYSGAKVAKMVQNSKPKAVTLKKINPLKNSISKPYNFSKFTKTIKLPKAKKITAIKKAIKKNVGY